MDEFDILTARLQRSESRVATLERMLEDKMGELFLDREKLKREHDHLAQILESMNQGILVTDSRSQVQSINKAACEVLCVDAAQVVGQKLSKALPVDWLPISPSIQAYEAFAEIYREEVLKRPDGTKVPIGMTLCVLRDNSGKVYGVVVIISNLTRNKQLERDLLQAQKLESIGRLSAGIAHEINTPIQYVRDNTIFMQNQFKDLSALLTLVQRIRDAAPQALCGLAGELATAAKSIDLDFIQSEIKPALEQTLEGAESVVRIVRSLKDFSHPLGEGKVKTDLNRALESTAVVSKNEWKYVADLELQLDPTLPLVECYPGELNQVFLNMIVNAAHAIEEKNLANRSNRGKILLKTARADDKVLIMIGDTGTGIPEEIRSKIFDPFFTTKPMGKGTGQGLALAYSTIVERHHGRIELQSQLGEGSTFCLELPR